MSQTLYRKYRPQKFSEIIGQNHIVQTLSNAIKNERIGHAYLFTGPRGTGKTTIARIFAKTVNCADIKNSEPCLSCENCKNIQNGRSLDIIEIDAASNTGVDNIRELREAVKLPPTRAKFKVYIIDEVHMLSTGAFNALLKTLEEPPAHVIFILATTEIHKIPDTIASRCQRFDFAKLPLENILKKLLFIAEKEGVKIEKNALEMIAIASEGGMRDAESLLAQVISLEDKNITSKEVEEILGTTDNKNIEEMAETLLAGKISESLKFVNRVSNEGCDIEVFNKALLNYFRKLLVVSVDENLAKDFSLELTSEQIEKIKLISKNKTGEILRIIENFSEAQNKIKSSFIPQLPLEIAIAKLGNYELKTISHENSKRDSEKEEQVAERPRLKKENCDVSETLQSKADAKKESEKETSGNSMTQETINLAIDDVKYKWEEIIKGTKPYNHSLSAFLLNCQPIEIKDGYLIIVTKYKFYKDKLSEVQNKLTIEKVLAKILGLEIRVKFLSEDEAGVKIKTKSPAPKDSSSSEKLNVPRETKSLLNDAMEMFGGKIVEE